MLVGWGSPPTAPNGPSAMACPIRPCTPPPRFLCKLFHCGGHLFSHLACLAVLPSACHRSPLGQRALKHAWVCFPCSHLLLRRQCIVCSIPSPSQTPCQRFRPSTLLLPLSLYLLPKLPLCAAAVLTVSVPARTTPLKKHFPGLIIDSASTAIVARWLPVYTAATRPLLSLQVGTLCIYQAYTITLFCVTVTLCCHWEGHAV